MALYKGNKKIAGLIRGEDISHATETHAGVIEIATQGEVLGGASDSKAVTPTKLNQYYYNKTNTNLLLASKQNKLNAGDNIVIDEQTNTISSTGGGAEIVFRKWSED